MEYKALSVTELNKYIKDKIATDELLNNVLMNYYNHFDLKMLNLEYVRIIW